MDVIQTDDVDDDVVEGKDTALGFKSDGLVNEIINNRLDQVWGRKVQNDDGPGMEPGDMNE